MVLLEAQGIAQLKEKFEYLTGVPQALQIVYEDGPFNFHAYLDLVDYKWHAAIVNMYFSFGLYGGSCRVTMDLPQNKIDAIVRRNTRRPICKLVAEDRSLETCMDLLIKSFDGLVESAGQEITATGKGRYTHSYITPAGDRRESPLEVVSKGWGCFRKPYSVSVWYVKALGDEDSF